MCRPASHGGLGVTSVKYKAQAVLIRSFMETSANPKFISSLLHSTLFRYHVLGDTSIPDPGYLPYYPASFFDTIRRVHSETPLNVTTMTTSQWVRVLTEEGLTMELADNKMRYIPCRAEISAPLNDWSQTWKLVRLQGLDSDLTSFCFKLLHGLLVTRERMQQLAPRSSALCSHCQDEVTETLQHALLFCSYNNGAGQSLLAVVQGQLQDVTPAALLRIELLNIQEDDQLSFVTFISTVLMEIWNKRFNKARIRLYDIRATLEARCQLLRETRFSGKIQSLTVMLSQF
jgi:hypothetical protein